MREYYQKPEVKARMREYRQKPEVKARKQNKDSMKAIIKEYHLLLGLEKHTVRQMRKLEALADVLGRDIDEWRSQQQKDEHTALLDGEWQFKGIRRNRE